MIKFIGIANYVLYLVTYLENNFWEILLILELLKYLSFIIRKLDKMVARTRIELVFPG